MTQRIGVNGKMFDVFDLAVCTDCLVMLANGTGTPEHAARMAREGPSNDITLGRMHSQEEQDSPDYDELVEAESEGWFSWSACDGCGDTDGGQRYAATAWVPATQCAECGPGYRLGDEGCRHLGDSNG